MDKAHGPAKLAGHLRALIAEAPGPLDTSAEDRLAAVRAELDALQITSRARRLVPAERRRYAHLTLIESRLLNRRHGADAVPPDHDGTESAEVFGRGPG